MKNKITRGQFIGSTMGLTFLTSSKLISSPLEKLMYPHQEVYHMDPTMKESYDIALNLLKPTNSQLEHGLELHKNSLIFDTYGFQPTAAIDGNAMVKAINDNASQLELQDLSEEMRMTRFVNFEKEKKEFENAWIASGE